MPQVENNWLRWGLGSEWWQRIREMKMTHLASTKQGYSKLPKIMNDIMRERIVHSITQKRILLSHKPQEMSVWFSNTLCSKPFILWLISWSPLLFCDLTSSLFLYIYIYIVQSAFPPFYLHSLVPIILLRKFKPHHGYQHFLYSLSYFHLLKGISKSISITNQQEE